MVDLRCMSRCRLLRLSPETASAALRAVSAMACSLRIETRGGPGTPRWAAFPNFTGGSAAHETFELAGRPAEHLVHRLALQRVAHHHLRLQTMAVDLHRDLVRRRR